MKLFLKKLLPSNFIDILKKLINRLDNQSLPLFASKGFLSSVYFAFFNSKFHREHQAVLKGRLEYAKSLDIIDQTSVLLRRNTHRLEKGLIMQPRRDIFAEAYIDETVACYEKCLSSASLCEDELKWAYDVLIKFFAVTSGSNVIDKAHSKFKSLAHKQNISSDESLPYRHEDRIQSHISAEHLHKLFKQRRSVRWYQDKQVDIKLIEKAVELASLAPSACNRQPFEFHVITNLDKATEVAKVAMGTAGFSDNIPALIAIVGDLSAYPKEQDRHVIYIDGGLVAMQLMLAFETLGLSTCPINWPDIEKFENKISKKLNLEYHHRTIMLMAVGHGDPDGLIPFSQKKSPSLLIKEVH